jgi:hypothetical protein
MTITESQPGTWSSAGRGVSASTLVAAGFVVSRSGGRLPERDRCRQVQPAGDRTGIS